jgi:hypothetical protein
VYTPVGARCRDCAGLKRLPTFDVRPVFLLRGIAAAVAVGAAAGGAWFLLVGRGRGGFAYLSLFLALAIGYAIGEAVSWATNRKRGAALQGVAAGGVVVAYFVHNLLGGSGLIAANDVYGYVTVGLGIVVAIGRLR